jgi:hypothetical protein
MGRNYTKLIVTAVAVMVFAAAGLAFAGSNGKADLKAGDEAYFCQCGPECACDTVSNNPGKCTCGRDLVKGKVTEAPAGKVKADLGKGKTDEYKTKGKFACACGDGCTCNTISQNPGKCTCGVDLKKVE